MKEKFNSKKFWSMDLAAELAKKTFAKSYGETLQNY